MIYNEKGIEIKFVSNETMDRLNPDIYGIPIYYTIKNNEILFYPKDNEKS